MSTPKPRLLLTGASSFLGAQVLLQLEKQFEVIGLYHQTPLTFTSAPSHQVDLTALNAVDSLQQLNVDWVIHLAGKIQSSPSMSATETNRKMLDSVLALNKPIVYASSTAVHWNYDIPYVHIRRQDEQRIQDSGLPYIIIRPCAPYGPKIPNHTPKHKESFQTLVQWIQHAPFIPVIGDGQYLRQPIHAFDFAALIAHCIQHHDINICFDAAGGSVHTFDEIIRVIQRKLHRHRPIMHVPKRLATLGARMFGNLEPSLVRAIDSSESFDVSDIQQRIPLRTFEEGCWDLLFD